jgi:hypothetical protein
LLDDPVVDFRNLFVMHADDLRLTWPRGFGPAHLWLGLFEIRHTLWYHKRRAEGESNLPPAALTPTTEALIGPGAKQRPCSQSSCWQFRSLE